MALPEGSEEIFHMVSILSNEFVEGNAVQSAMVEAEKQSIIRICAQLGCKQYLPQHQDTSQWRRHFGSKWEVFVQNNQSFDPRAILARDRTSSQLVPTSTSTFVFPGTEFGLIRTGA